MVAALERQIQVELCEFGAIVRDPAERENELTLGCEESVVGEQNNQDRKVI